MMALMPMLCRSLVCVLAALTISQCLFAQQPPGGPGGPPALRPGQELMRQGKLDEAFVFYQSQLKTAPDPTPVHMAMGVVLDLLGRSDAARAHFGRAIDIAPSPLAKAQA